MEVEECSDALETPIKHFRELTLHSPPQNTIRYPSMSDMDTRPEDLAPSMAQKGYSQTLSSAVLRELDSRAQEILSKFSDSAIPDLAGPKLRYSAAHRPLFQKMESISAHYAAQRSKKTMEEIPLSATKKRRTLNGPEEFFALQDPSPTRRKQASPDRGAPHVTRVPTNTAATAWAASTLRGKPAPRAGSGPLVPVRLAPVAGSQDGMESDAGRLSPVRPEGLLRTGSPVRTLNPSPLRLNRISPSKGFMNLNKILLEGPSLDEAPLSSPVVQRTTESEGTVLAGSAAGSHSSEGFAKPNAPARFRPSSLQLAGVRPLASGKSELRQNPSNSSLLSLLTLRPEHRLPSEVGLSRPATARSSLQTPKTHGIIPSSKSLATLGHKPTWAAPKTVSRTIQPSSSFQKPALPKLTSTKSFGTEQPKPSASGRPHVTVPKPFSLYNKPTISLSQKSFDAAAHQAPNDLFLLSASQRSINRFQRFKSRFS